MVLYSPHMTYKCCVRQKSVLSGWLGQSSSKLKTAGKYGCVLCTVPPFAHSKHQQRQPTMLQNAL